MREGAVESDLQLFRGSASFFPRVLLRELAGGARRVGHGWGLGLQKLEFGLCSVWLGFSFLLVAKTWAFHFGAGVPGSTAPNPGGGGGGEFETLILRPPYPGRRKNSEVAAMLLLLLKVGGAFSSAGLLIQDSSRSNTEQCSHNQEMGSYLARSPRDREIIDKMIAGVGNSCSQLFPRRGDGQT